MTENKKERGKTGGYQCYRGDHADKEHRAQYEMQVRALLGILQQTQKTTTSVLKHGFRLDQRLGELQVDLFRGWLQ